MVRHVNVNSPERSELIGFWENDDRTARRTVTQIQRLLEAQKRLGHEYGSRPDGVLILNLEREVLLADSFVVETLNVDLAHALGQGVSQVFDAKVARSILECLEFLGEKKPLALQNDSLNIVGVQEDNDLLVGLWALDKEDQLLERLDSNWLDMSEILREFLDAKSLLEVVRTTESVMELSGSSVGGIYLPVSGSLTLVGQWSDGANRFVSFVDPREINEGFIVPSGSNDELLLAPIAEDLVVAPVYRQGKLNCVLVANGDQESVVEIARWVASALVRFN